MAELPCEMPETMCYLREQVAERRGAAQVLREIAKLQEGFRAPWVRMNGECVGDTHVRFEFECKWCGVEETRTYECGTYNSTPQQEIPHPANGCLWPRALAVVTPEGER